MERVVLLARLQDFGLGVAGRGILVGLGVPAPGAALDQRWPGAAAGAMNRLLGDAPHGDDIVPVNGDAGNAVGLGAIAQVIVGLHGIRSVAVRLVAIFHDEDDGQPLLGGQAGGFVPETKSGETVVGERHDDVGFLELTIGESDSGGDIELPGDGRGLGNDAQRRCFGGRMRGEIFLLEIEQLGEDALEWSVT